MEVKIGVKGANRELVVETAASADEVAAAVRAALTDDCRPARPVSDDKGRQVMVPAEKVAYVELGESETRKVGFGAL